MNLLSAATGKLLNNLKLKLPQKLTCFFLQFFAVTFQQFSQILKDISRGIFLELDLILMLRASVLAPATIFSEYGSLEASLLRVRHH